MANIEAKIILDSISEVGTRLTTFQLKFPRFILAELNTHRMLSRNSMSSRAIPVEKMISQVWNDPAMPVHWGTNQPGMQAKVELSGVKLWAAKYLWKMAAKTACVIAWGMTKAKLHKQVANRVLEPWQHMHTIVTATELDNFFALRCHPDAQPEFQHLASLMHAAHTASTPTPTTTWHLPYVTEEERRTHTLEDQIKVSVARCARVSYLTHDKKAPVFETDVKLHDRLVGSVPIHASPAEHQAWPSGDAESFFANFKEWVQYRKDLELLAMAGKLNER